MATTTTYEFGKYQPYVSDKMRQNPGKSKLVASIFGYTNLGTWGRAVIFERLLNLIPMKKIKTVMDLGCGQGEFAFMIADAHTETIVDAVDTDVAAMQKITETVEKFNIKNINTYTGMIQDLDKNDHYDMIFSIDVFQHIPVDQMPFQECYKKLKKGGYLITKMPAKKHKRILPKSWFREFDDTLAGKRPDKDYMTHHGQVYDLQDLVKRYEQENFKVIAAFYSDGIIARAGWEINYLMMKGGPILHLLSLPLGKFLMKLDGAFKNKKSGNIIQVIGQKV